MVQLSPQTEQHIILAVDRHRRLVEDADRYRTAQAARASQKERPLRWRRLRQHVGELLIMVGQRIKAGVAENVAEPAANRGSEQVWG